VTRRENTAIETWLLAYMDGGNEGPVSDFLRALIDKAKGERL